MSDKTTTPEPLVTTERMAKMTDLNYPNDRQNDTYLERSAYKHGLYDGASLYETDRSSHLSRIQELEDQVKALRANTHLRSMPDAGEGKPWTEEAVKAMLREVIWRPDKRKNLDTILASHGIKDL